VLCVVRYKSLPRADHSCRGFVASVVFVSVVNPDNEEALACLGLLDHGEGGGLWLSLAMCFKLGYEAINNRYNNLF
jgi:hypothetical protein